MKERENVPAEEADTSSEWASQPRAEEGGER